MPKCINDTKRTYKGNEPSPKGFGYCAHGMKEGDKKKGKDGNMWVVKKIKNSSLRWTKLNEYDIDKLRDYLEKKIYKWWIKLAKGSLIIVYKDNSYKKLFPPKGSSKKKIYIFEKKWDELGKDKNVKYIVWSNMSYEVVEHFVNYLLFETPNNIIEKFMTSKNTLDIFIKNIKKLTLKLLERTNKDYILQGKYVHYITSKKKREIENNKNKNKLLKKLIKSNIIKKNILR